MDKSRQVQRAEFRREMKRGERRRKLIDRKDAQLKLERRKAPASSLRMAAQRAVSRLGRDHGKAKFA